MAQSYRGRHLVHVLAAWATRSSENLFELGLKDTELFHALLNRSAGTTFVMVTHDPRAAAKARRLVHLEKGRLADAP